MLMEVLFSIVLSYEQFVRYGCVLYITNDDITKLVSNNTLTSLVISPDKILTEKDIGVWDACPNIIISSDNPRQTLESYEIFLRKHGNGMDDRKYIIWYKDHQHNMFDGFFLSSALHFIADMIVLKEFPDKCEIYTHKYVGLTNATDIILLDIFYDNQTFLYDNNLLPNKLNNVQGRILNIGAAKYVPLSDPVKMQGLETKFLLEYVKRYNYTLRFDKREVRLGLQFPNNTATGFTKLMLQDQLDLITYGLYIQQERRSFGEFSFPMSEISLTCIVPKPRLINEWTIIYILNYDVWLLMAFSYLILVAIFNLILFIRKQPTDIKFTNETTYFMVFRIFGAQPHQQFMKNKDRLLLGTLLSLMIIIHTYFTSKLASFNTVPLYKDKIETISDMADSGINWYTKYYDEIKSMETATTYPLANLYKTFLNASQEELIEMMNTKQPKHFGFAINQSFNSKYYTIFDYFTLENLNYFQIIKDHLIRNQYTAFFVRRNSILLPSLNEYWSYADQHGFGLRWEIDTVEGTDRLIQRYLATSNRVNANANVIKIPELAGTFIIWSVGLGISIFTFLIEVLHSRFFTSCQNIIKNKSTNNI